MCGPRWAPGLGRTSFARMEEKTSMRLRARVNKTFNRRSPPCLRQGTERLRNRRARAGRTVNGGDENDVAFVTLDHLEVLDGERVERRFPSVDEPPQVTVPGGGLIQHFVKQVPLRLVHGDDREALVPVPVIRHEAENRIHDRLRLDPVPVVVVNAAIDQMVIDAVVAGTFEGRGKNDQLIVVEILIRKLDQGAVAGTIVPLKSARRRPHGQREIEDGLGRVHKRPVLVVRRHAGAQEKGRGRQLLRVSDNNGALAARQRTDGVGRQDLRRLIDDDQIEQLRPAGQQLGNRRRRHHEAGLELLQGPGGTMHQLTNRNTGALKTQLMADQRQLRIRAGWANVVARRDLTLLYAMGDPSAFKSLEFLIQLSELCLVIRKLIACQAPQARVLREDGVGKGPVEKVAEKIGQPAQVGAAALQGAQDGGANGG